MNESSEQHPEALLADYAVDNLPAAQRRAMERHLAACPRCRARLRSLEATAALLRRLPPPELPRSFALPGGALAAAPRRQAAPWLLPVSFLSAAAVLFLALGLSLAAPRPATVASYSAAAPSRTDQGAASDGVSLGRGAPAENGQPGAAAATTAASAAASTSAAAAAAPAIRAAPAPQPAPAAPTPAPPAQSRQPSAAAPPTGPPSATMPIRARLLPYQVLLTAGGIICMLVGLGAAFRAARR